jgi:hypothetical protein
MDIFLYTREHARIKREEGKKKNNNKKKKKKNCISYLSCVVVKRGTLHMVSEPVRPATWGSLRLSLS